MAGPTSLTAKEREVRDALCPNLGAKTMTEVLTPSGSVDVLSENEVIEVKHYRLWKFGIGQAIAYGYYYPSHKKRLHLFAQKGDKRASKYIQLATPVCSAYGIEVTFEKVSHENYGVATEENTEASSTEAGEKRKNEQEGITALPRKRTKTRVSCGRRARVGVNRAENVATKPHSKLRGTYRKANVRDDEEAKSLFEHMVRVSKEYVDEKLPGMTREIISCDDQMAAYKQRLRGEVEEDGDLFGNDALRTKLLKSNGQYTVLFSRPELREYLCSQNHPLTTRFYQVFGNVYKVKNWFKKRKSGDDFQYCWPAWWP